MTTHLEPGPDRELAMTMPSASPGWADDAEPGWFPARITPYGPGYSRYAPGKGLLQVGYESRQYRWWLLTGPAKAIPGRAGFARGRQAMRDADQLAGALPAGMSAALAASRHPAGPGSGSTSGPGKRRGREPREVPATDQVIRAFQPVSPCPDRRETL